MKTYYLTIVGVFSTCIFGCDSPKDSPVAPVPTIYLAQPFEGDWDVKKADDINPKPDVVEVNLEAREEWVEYLPGRKQLAWTYNGTVPGPLLAVNVGDKLIVHFTNNLPEATTIHWHGIRVPAAMDGTEIMQKPILPGGTFTYSFQVTDAGTFWYHPHVRSDEQVEKGLYGPIVVRRRVEPASDDERVVMLDDVMVDAKGRMSTAYMMDHEMVGRQGNLALANGKARPVLAAPKNSRQRLRLINASNARYFNLQLPGNDLIWLGTDGSMFPAPKEVSSILLVPGERADVIVVPQSEGETDFVSLPYDRGHRTSDVSNMPLMLIRSANSIAAKPVSWAVTAATAVTYFTAQNTLNLEERTGMNGGMGGGHMMEMGGNQSMSPVFLINGEQFPDVTPLTGKLGTAQEWVIVNKTEMDHPFHLHGFMFQVIGGQFGTAWKDTVNVPAKATVRLAIQLDGFPGSWMFHCHILEHAERGMAGILEINE